jgi:chromosome partitioning protein
MRSTKRIVIAGRKGGTGKTALCLGLAAVFSRMGLAVLVVDLDPQGSASLALGAAADGEHLAAVLNGTAAPEPAEVAGGMLLLSGGPALESLTDPRPLLDVLAERSGADEAFPDWPRPDVVLVDCPPGHPTLDRLAMSGADAVLVATEPHRLAIAGAARVLDEAKALRPIPRCAVVLGRLDPRRGLDRAAPELLAGAFNATVLAIHQDTALAAALNAGELPPEHGRAADDLRAVAAWLNLFKP